MVTLTGFSGSFVFVYFSFAFFGYTLVSFGNAIFFYLMLYLLDKFLDKLKLVLRRNGIEIDTNPFVMNIGVRNNAINQSNYVRIIQTNNDPEGTSSESEDSASDSESETDSSSSQSETTNSEYESDQVPRRRRRQIVIAGQSL